MSKRAFYLRPYELKLSLHSLNSKGVGFFKPVLKRVTKKLDLKTYIKEEILKKKELKNYSVGDRKVDGCVLIHRDDGRLLITDKNGIYDNFIRKMYNKTSKEFANFRGKYHFGDFDYG